jgi:hypothetical protein
MRSYLDKIENIIQETYCKITGYTPQIKQNQKEIQYSGQPVSIIERFDLYDANFLPSNQQKLEIIISCCRTDQEKGPKPAILVDIDFMYRIYVNTKQNSNNQASTTLTAEQENHLKKFGQELEQSFSQIEELQQIASTKLGIPRF